MPTPTYTDKGIKGGTLKSLLQQTHAKIKKVASDAATTYEPKMTAITDDEINNLT